VAADKALEDERAEALRLLSEVGRLKAELDIAATTRTELSAASAELDTTLKEAYETSTRLQSTVRALDQQRAESERLRLRLTASEATVRRLTEARAAADAEAASAGAPASSRRERLRREPAQREAHARPDEDLLDTAVIEPALTRGPTASSRRGRPSGRPETAYVRPLNPALRSRPNWFGRALALVVILAVIAAIVLVIHNTGA
jgi:hypothetical protein